MTGDHVAKVIYGGYWIPLNILLTFALCAAAVYAASERRWVVLAFAAVVLPAFVDYQWSGVAFALLVLAGFVPLSLFNGNLWALAALPVVVALSGVRWQLPRGRWAFYGYYVGHLAILVAFAT